MISRRGSTRRAVTVPCQAVRERDFKLIADRTLDLSSDGMLVTARERVLTGESVIVSFYVPGCWIDAECTVARVIHGRRPTDEGPAIGLVFDVISPASRAALAGFLHGRRQVEPKRLPTGGGDIGDIEALRVLRAMASAWMNLAIN